MFRPRLLNALLLFALAACSTQVPVFDGTPTFVTDLPGVGDLQGRWVVTDSANDTLSVVDPLTRSVATVQVGLNPVDLEGPHHLVAAPNGARLFVPLSLTVAGSGSGPHGAHGSGKSPGYLLELDTRDGRLLRRLRVDPSPGDAFLVDEGRTLVVSHYDLLAWARGAAAGDLRTGDSALWEIDTSTLEMKRRTPVCPATHAVRPSPDARLLHATCGPDEFASFDRVANTVARHLLPGASEGAGCTRCPYALGVDSRGDVLVASLGPNGGAEGGGGLDLWSASQQAFVARLDLCGRALFPAHRVGSVGEEWWVPEQGPCGDHLHRLRSASDGGLVDAGSIEFPSGACTNPHAVEFDEARGEAVVVCEGDHLTPGALHFIDLASFQPSGAVPVGLFPDGAVRIPVVPR